VGLYGAEVVEKCDVVRIESQGKRVAARRARARRQAELGRWREREGERERGESARRVRARE
jgi:hypothetical protein